MTDNPPGTHCALVVKGERAEQLLHSSTDWPTWDLTRRQLADVECILNGAYAPLTGFMTRRDRDACETRLELADGTPFPAPVLIKVSSSCAAAALVGTPLLLRDPETVPIAVLWVADVWRHMGPDSNAEQWGLGGRLEGLRLPQHYDFARLRLTPDQVGAETSRRGWTRLLAYVTREVITQPEFESIRAAMDRIGAATVIVATSDLAGPVSLDHYVRVRCHQKLLRHFPERSAMLWLANVPAIESPTHEVMLHALVARNAGCSHLLDRRGHSMPAAMKFAARLGIEIVPDTLNPSDIAPARGRTGFPEIDDELEAAHPPNGRRGFAVFFTGLSGSGKSTIANILRVRLLEIVNRHVTLLDGDLVRKHLSSELGFSREHRDINVRRIGFVASEIAKHGGIAICAPIAPYETTRAEVRRDIEAVGGFLLVYVDTPLEVCERRDRKGLYARARAGLIENFTGVSDAYEPPADADLVIHTTEAEPDDAAERVIHYLRAQGYLPSSTGDASEAASG